MIRHMMSPFDLSQTFDLSGWWWLISSMFLTRTSFCKTWHSYSIGVTSK